MNTNSLALLVQRTAQLRESTPNHYQQPVRADDVKDVPHDWQHTLDAITTNPEGYFLSADTPSSRRQHAER